MKKINKKMRYLLSALLCMICLLGFGTVVRADSMSTAETIAVGGVKQGYLGYQGNKYLKFTLTKSCYLRIELSTHSSNEWLYMYLKDSSGNFVTSTEYLTTEDENGRGYQTGYKYYGLNAGTYYIDLNTSAGANYRVAVVPVQYSSSSVKIAGYRNNYRSSAETFSIGNTLISAAVNNARLDECHYYKFVLSAAKKVRFTFKTTGLGYGSSMFFHVYNAAGTAVGNQVALSQSANQKIIEATLPKGTYYLGVATTENTAPYSVKTQYVEKKAQVITAKNYTRTLGSKSFKLNAKRTTGNGKLTYASSKKSVAKVNKYGKVTIVGVGKTTITITAAETSKYKKTVKQITVTVRPKKSKITSASSPQKEQMLIKWKKVSNVTGYQIQYATNSSFKSAGTYTSSNKYTGVKFTNASRGKRYYVRVRTYKKVNGTNYYSKWSAKKSVVVK